MTTRVLIPLLLSLAALASPGIAAARGAANQQLTQNEIEIAKAFDSAVRTDASLDSLSKLPWAPGAVIYVPEMLGALKFCTPSHAEKIGDTLILTWDSDPDGTHRCGGDGSGYYAHLKLKKGRIKRVLFGEYEIVVT